MSWLISLPFLPNSKLTKLHTNDLSLSLSKSLDSSSVQVTIPGVLGSAHHAHCTPLYIEIAGGATTKNHYLREVQTSPLILPVCSRYVYAPFICWLLIPYKKGSSITDPPMAVLKVMVMGRGVLCHFLRRQCRCTFLDGPLCDPLPQPTESIADDLQMFSSHSC